MKRSTKAPTTRKTNETPEPAVLETATIPTPIAFKIDRSTAAFRATVSAAFFLFYWYFWGVRYGDFLYQAQESGIFLFRQSFFCDCVGKPGGFLIYATRFVSQFFYYPVLGGAILAGVLATIRRLAERLFSANVVGKNGATFALSFLVPAILTTTATWRGYSIYVPFEPSAPFVSIFGTFVAFAFATLYSTLETPRRRLVFAVATVAFGYPLFGFWALFAALLALVQELNEPEPALRSNDEKTATTNRAPFADKKLRLELIFLAALAIPLIWHWAAFYQRVRFADVYWAPTFEPRLAEKWPFARTSALIGWSALLATSLLAPFAARHFFYRKSLKLDDLQPSFLRVVSTFLFGAALAASIWFGSFGDANFFALLACKRPLEKENWDEILRIESTVSRPSAPLVGLRNLALYYTGKLGEKAFERPVDGLRTAPTSEPARLEIYSPEIALYFGRINVGTRLATNSFVASDENSTAFLKTLCVAEIAAGNEELARDYLRILDATLFYRNWASEYRQFLDAPNAETAVLKEKIDAKLERIRRLKPNQDTFVIEFPNAVVLDGLSDAPWESSTRRELEIRLTNLLARRSLQEFARRLDETTNRAESAPTNLPQKHFQEARLLAAALVPSETIPQKFVVDEKIRANFDKFQRFRADVDFSTPNGRRQLFERFGSTYWAFYFDDSKSSETARVSGVLEF